MTEPFMNTAMTAWRNGRALETVGYPAGAVETYRAAYIKAFDFGPSDRLQAAADMGVMELILALEDAALDRCAREARDEFRKVEAILPADPDADPMSGRRGEY